MLCVNKILLQLLIDRFYISQVAVLEPMKTFIHLMEQTKRPTISLVLPMVHKMLLLLDPSRTLTVTDYEDGEDADIMVKPRCHVKVPIDYVLCIVYYSI